MFAPLTPAFSFRSGVRIACPWMFARAAATSCAVGNRSFESATTLPPLEVNDLARAGHARLLEHVVGGGKILWGDSKRLVERHIQRGMAPDL